MKKLLFILLATLFLFSCENQFPDYTEKDEGVFMKLISFDEEDISFRKNKHVITSMEFYDGDKLIFKQYKELPISPNTNNFKFLFNYLNEGDSAIFQIDTSVLKKECPKFQNITFNNQFLIAKIKVHKYLKSITESVDEEMLEQILLKKYLKELGESKTKPGLYIKKLKQGEGKSIARGDLITIHYKGYFINRLEFDNTYKTMDFTFTYGSPGQVIKGLEIALKGMKKGEKAKIIIPSQLAFGEEGSSTNIIPPYTTVVYELEIVNVK